MRGCLAGISPEEYRGQYTRHPVIGRICTTKLLATASCFRILTGNSIAHLYFRYDGPVFLLVALLF
jgi:hypothetical protein